MKTLLLCGLALASLPAAAMADDFFDRVDQALTWSSHDASLRARVSGLLDLEGYALPDPAPGVIEAEPGGLFNPRLTVFLDAQAGDHVYAFAQGRVDRGFDPSRDGLRSRLDEYAVRWTPSRHGGFNLQAGKFATVVGSWALRHDSWTNPFITAPLPYENLTGVWDNEPPRSAAQLLVWSHVRPGLSPWVEEKYLQLPIIWGPSYAAGLAAAGGGQAFRYALEVKNASLSSRPDAWSPRESQWDHPTFSGRVRYLPNESWEFGWSASDGSFLRPVAGPLLRPGIGRAEYRQLVLGQDVSFAWHHLQLWAEVYLCRFEIPAVGHADTMAYYVESRYRFTPRFSAAVRWNEQFFGRIDDRGTAVQWGKDTWRIDLAPAFRLTPHAQLKLQYSVQEGGQEAQPLTQMLAVQGTVRF